ncbi:hypothetical protein [Spirosoma montaniterrae]|uniref:Uncharacterized protein n=1 Tax=Spirosoma montaniterrae TaxID=1178516 RepID=A0A1P9X1J7_9BACT|nr:hypothetical protein [Spirosoma montaniterrae]AQG81501.1 hypothetical protein AWR27_20595 [Spirosoma montaniterrae]
MNRFAHLLLLLLAGSATAQTKPGLTTPPSVVSLISGITTKQFQPDTAFAALSKEDETLLAKEPVANWGLPQTSGDNMTYYNLVVGTRSYQLVVKRLPKSDYPTATLLRYTTPQSKPEPIAQGVLKSEEAGKTKP